jgi:hypothetical protein
VLYFPVLCYVVLCFSVLCFSVLCYAALQVRLFATFLCMLRELGYDVREDGIQGDRLEGAGNTTPEAAASAGLKCVRSLLAGPCRVAEEGHLIHLGFPSSLLPLYRVGCQGERGWEDSVAAAAAEAAEGGHGQAGQECVTYSGGLDSHALDFCTLVLSMSRMGLTGGVTDQALKLGGVCIAGEITPPPAASNSHHPTSNTQHPTSSSQLNTQHTTSSIYFTVATRAGCRERESAVQAG